MLMMTHQYITRSIQVRKNRWHHQLGYAQNRILHEHNLLQEKPTSWSKKTSGLSANKLGITPRFLRGMPQDPKAIASSSMAPSIHGSNFGAKALNFGLKESVRSAFQSGRTKPIRGTMSTALSTTSLSAPCGWSNKA